MSREVAPRPRVAHHDRLLVLVLVLHELRRDHVEVAGARVRVARPKFSAPHPVRRQPDRVRPGPLERLQRRQRQRPRPLPLCRWCSQYIRRPRPTRRGHSCAITHGRRPAGRRTAVMEFPRVSGVGLRPRVESLLSGGGVKRNPIGRLTPAPLLSHPLPVVASLDHGRGAGSVVLGVGLPSAFRPAPASRPLPGPRWAALRHEAGPLRSSRGHDAQAWRVQRLSPGLELGIGSPLVRALRSVARLTPTQGRLLGIVALTPAFGPDRQRLRFSRWQAAAHWRLSTRNRQHNDA